MNVILLEKVGKLGSVGDVANVKSGYARNYLFPKGIAIPATKNNLVDFEGRKSELMAAHNEKLAIAQKRAGKIDGISITIEVNASDEGKLFGSVGTKDITDAINAAGGDVSKSEVQLSHGAIRETGTYEINIDLGFDVSPKVSLVIAPIAGAKPPIVDAETGEELEAQTDNNAEAISASGSDDESENSVEEAEETDEEGGEEK
jgi:large subunit ribosomal protein L9